MVKLATARDFRLYGPRGAHDKWEYINAGLFLFATILLIGGFLAQLSSIPFYVKSGLVLLLVGLLIISLVNVHDWIAHLAGIDWRFGLAEYDQQLALVEIALPVVSVIGSMLFFVAVLFFGIEMDRGYMHKLEKHALNLLIAGFVLWLGVASAYGKFLFVVGSIVNWIEMHRLTDDSSTILNKDWAWFGIFGSILLFTGGLLNLVKVFKMQQMDGIGLERLSGGARERLSREREGQVPLLDDNQTESRSRRRPIRKLYKDVLVESSTSQV